jgi:hypothetical protein
MLDRDEIHMAVDLHRRSYKLLRWLSTAMSKGFIQFDRAHDYLDEFAAAREWIERHFLNLPPSCRPALEQVEPFSRFFATYLTTSFDLVEKPLKRVASECGCWCPICTYLVSAPQLRAKKVSRHDKTRARKLKLAVLQRLAQEHDIHLDLQKAEQFLESDCGPHISMVTYGQQLVARTLGKSEGPSVLALWRELAWEKTGAPKKNFHLEADDILDAERVVVGKIVTI